MLVGHASAQEATIVTLGDSNMSGFGVGAQEAFPASLEAMLRKREERFPPFLGDFDEKSSRPRTELKRGLIPAQIPLLLSPSEAMAGLASEVCYPTIKPPPEFALGSLNWRIPRRLPCSSERNMQRATSVILPAITSDLRPARAPSLPRGMALRTARGMAYKCA